MPGQQVMDDAGGIRTAAPMMPEWTAEDFENTDRPYAWLYQQRDNKFLFQQMLGRMAKQAKKVRFAGFSRVWAAYVDAMSPKQTILGVNTTLFPDQPVQLQSGKYVCDERGISYTGQMGEAVEVCSHPLMPIKRIINLDSNEEKLELAYCRGTPKWKTMIAARETLASAQRIIGLARNGIAVNSENAKEIVKYLSEVESLNYTDLPVQNSTSHMGWLPGGEFAPYCEGVVYDGESPEFARMFGDFAETGSEETWMELALQVRAGKSVPARMALAASFAAPLVEKLGALPFFVHLWGTQGCGKTVGLMLAASVWGNPTVGRYVKTFSGTKVSQEVYAAFCGNLPILLDELQVISDRKLFDEIIYALCEGVSKGRGAKEGGLRLQQRWSTCILTTGEMPIIQSNSGGGAAVRTIEVNYGGEPLFEDARAVANTLKENYGFAGKKFIEAIRDEVIFSSLKAKQKWYYGKLSGDIQDKQVLSASILLAADKLADAVLFRDGRALTVSDVKPYLVTREQADVNLRCYQWLMGYIGGNPMRFEDGDANGGELWGVFGEEDGKRVVYIIKPFFEKMLRVENFSAGAFLTWAKRNGKILCDSWNGNVRLTKRKRIHGQAQTCVALVVDDGEPKVDEQTGFERVDPEDDLPF